MHLPVHAAFFLLLPLALQDDPFEAEARRGEEGRVALRATLERTAAARTAPAPTALDVFESSLGLSFAAVQAEGLRVLSTAGQDEARAVAGELLTARGLFATLCGVPAQFPEGARALLLGSSEERDQFLSKHPRVTLEERVRLMKLEGTGIPGTADWAFWEGDPEKRRDGLVRFAFDWFLQSVGVRHDTQTWLHDGLGFYLTHALTGTRLTWFTPAYLGGGSSNEENVALLARMKEGEDWMALAVDRFAPELRFDLEEVLHLLPGELDPSDYLRVHALAAYLVEVHPAALGTIVTRIGAEEDPRDVLQEALGFDFDELRGRLDRWVRAREALVAKQSGRRSAAEVTALWKRAGPEAKRAAVKLFKARLAELDTAQMRAQRLALALASEAPVKRVEAGHFDPAEHAPAQPIPRKRLGAGDARAKRLLESVRGKNPPPGPAIDFDWGRGVVVRLDDPEDPESVYRNALRGIPLGAELARARLLQHLERPADRSLHAAFEHAYTDREGNVFPLTLYEMWGSGQTMEMPDVDTLGIVHSVLNDWQRWTAPVPGDQQAPLYKVVGELYRGAKRQRELFVGLADVFLFPQGAARGGSEALTVELHALWAFCASDPERLALILPLAKDCEAFTKELAQRVRRDPQYARGRPRAAELRADGERVRGAFASALEEALAAVAAPR